MRWDDDEYSRFENMLSINAFQASAISFGNNFQASGSGTPGPKGDKGDTGEQGLPGKDGLDGTDGKSAYQIAVDNGFTGTEQEWLDSLRGVDGTDGVDGKDGLNGELAYEIAVKNGFVGTEAEWLASLKGKDGVDGKDGTNGVDGTPGKDGVNGKDGKDGAPGLVPIIYHADLSKNGNQIEIWVDSIRAQYIYRDSTSISFNIKTGLSGNVIVDLKRSSQYDGAASEGSTFDNYTLTSSYQSVDTIIYNSSRETHRTWIRTQDPTTGLWNLYQIDLFISNGGARTDIVVWTLYTNLAAPW